MLFVTLKVKSAYVPSSTYDKLLEREYRKQLSRIWTFIIIYLIIAILLLLYDLGLYYQDVGRCTNLIVSNQLGDAIIWTLSRVLGYYLRAFVCVWAFAKRKDNRFTSIDIDVNLDLIFSAPQAKIITMGTT